MNESMPHGSTGDEIGERNEAEMAQRLRAMVGEPDFFDTHVLDKSGNIIPKGEHWDRA
ncbi:MAG: hypothetical protein ACREGR_00775 [Minisyncoccia bacterium]